MSGVEPHDLDESFLSAYLDGELDDATRAVVDARLVESPAWRAELADVRTARDAVRSLPAAEPPSGFWDDVFAAGGDANVTSLGARGRRARGGRWSALAGAAAAAAVLGVVLVPRPEPVHPAFATLTQTHAERASVGNDVVSNLAGAVVPASANR